MSYLQSYQVCKATAGENDGTVYSGTSRIGRGPKHGPRTGEVQDHINRVDPTASKTIDDDDRSPSAHEFLHGILHETRNEKVLTGISDTTGTLPTRLGLLCPFNPLNLLIAKLTLKSPSPPLEHPKLRGVGARHSAKTQSGYAKS
jgi:hypothetical protein